MQTSVESPTVPGALASMLGHLAIVGVASLVTGVVVGGVGGRLFMRVAAIIAPDHATGLRTDAGFIVGEITLATVFFVIFVGLAAGLVGAVVYVVCEPWMAWAGPGRGLLFGLVLLAVAARPSDSLGADNRDFVILGEPLPLVLMVLGLFLGFGLMLVAVLDHAERRFGATMAGAGTVPLAILLVIGSPLAILISANLFFRAESCGCDVPTAASWLLLGLAGCSAAWWMGRVSGRQSSLLNLGGHALFAVTLLVGARQTVSDIGSIL